VTPGDLLVADAGIRAAGQIAPTNLLDLNVSWNKAFGGPVDLSFFATNVTGEKYYTFSQGTGTTGAEFQGIGAPAMYGFRMKVNFGN